ncbi:hypothetical protein M885DRAFT_616198 [Pelagophyceae sp. CCMP2097]|nr:hypothetical protein M885DRAFT_616198 [Pelagophyceae sp. CCMP2097]
MQVVLLAWLSASAALQLPRRAALARGAAVVAAPLAAPLVASAAASDVDAWRRLVANRPAIPTVPRQRLVLDFAVQLMRSSYNAVDDLDFVAMDAFQKKFFLLRQDEWQPYKDKVAAKVGSPPFQGDLEDASYFDFISFAQYETINECLKRPQALFEELVDAEGETLVVARANGVNDGDLAAAHARIVGDSLLAFISDRFQDIAFDASTPQDVAANVRRLVNWLCVLGFAADSTVSLDGSALSVRLLGPANLWSLKATKANAAPNDFLAKLVQAYLRRVGQRDVSPKLTIDATSTTHVFKLQG